MKHKTSLSISEYGRELLWILSKKLGISKSDVMELAIRKLAEAETVDVKGAQDQA